MVETHIHQVVRDSLLAEGREHVSVIAGCYVKRQFIRDLNDAPK